MQEYKVFDHTADIGVEIYGRTKRELFANAARCLNDIMIERTEPVSVKEDTWRETTVTVEGADLPDLLVNFLRELLYLFHGKKAVIGLCAILACGNQRLVARLIFEPYCKKKHAMKTEVKAITYHGLTVEKIENSWKARVIFDV
jgi:SHS2 domain-containing protein